MKPQIPTKNKVESFQRSCQNKSPSENHSENFSIFYENWGTGKAT
jgi:hypothetical protein